MSLIEEGAATVTSTVSILRRAPMLLVLLVVILAMLGMITYLVMESSQMRERQSKLTLEILERCVLRQSFEGSPIGLPSRSDVKASQEQ